MNEADYNELRDNLINYANDVSFIKSQDYTLGNRDVLHNFKNVASRLGLKPLQILGTYMLKHQDAISNYIKENGQSESEPIQMRIIDNINYLCLLWGLINDTEEPV